MKDFTVIHLCTGFLESTMNRTVLLKMTGRAAPLVKIPQQLISFSEEKHISYHGLQDPAHSGPCYQSSLLSITLQPHWPPLRSSHTLSTFFAFAAPCLGGSPCHDFAWLASLGHLIWTSLTLPSVRLNDVILMSFYSAVPHKLNIILKSREKRCRESSNFIWFKLIKQLNSNPLILTWVPIFFFKNNIYLAAPGLSCSMQSHRCCT